MFNCVGFVKKCVRICDYVLRLKLKSTRIPETCCTAKIVFWIFPFQKKQAKFQFMSIHLRVQDLKTLR